MTIIDHLPIRFLADPPGLPPLLMMHGFLSSRNHWLPNLPALRGSRRIVLAELPGHGETRGCTDPSALHPDALADTLDEGRRALGIKSWSICGQSFGASITLRHALRHPGSVNAQIWTNGNRVVARPWSEEDLAANAARRARLATEGREALARERFHPRFARRFPAAIREILSRDADNCDIDTLVALMDHTTPNLSLRDRFAETRVPTLLVNGRLERPFQVHRDFAAAALPSMEVVDLEGGHSINIEQPEAFDAAVLDFLARIEPASPDRRS
ncbi:alpha/beta hydrolase [Mesorhizobium sp. CAU 1741]|uniref:alpha/beta fold hydrolase n=1 Tax=Mesorhizobium sp. CAU 1741 TaxID=3140366 RepID=UPI00325B413F